MDTDPPVSGDAMDLVERLRLLAKVELGWCGQTPAGLALAEAADEIERLRSQGGAPEGWAHVPAIGTYVEADHPITCLNPTKAFEVRFVDCVRGHWLVRGDNTCWFGVNSVKPATRENAIAAEEAAMLAAAPQPPVSQSGAPSVCDGKLYAAVISPITKHHHATLDVDARAHLANAIVSKIKERGLMSVSHPEGGTGWRPVPGDASPSMVMAALAVDWSGGDGDEEAVVHNVWNAMLGTAPSPPGQGDRTNDGEAGEFKPDWSLTENESAQVALSLALTRYVPGWPGATNEQLGAVASDVLAALPRKDVEGAAYRVGDRVEKYTGDAMYVGTVVSVYLTVRGKLRYVVDVEPQRFQMISNESQLRPAIRDLGKQTGGAS